MSRVDRSRVLMSLYAAGGLGLWCFIVTFFNPRIYEKIEETKHTYQGVGQIPPPEIVYIPGGLIPPDYPLRFYVCLIALVVVPLIYFAPSIARLLRFNDTPLYRCVFTVVVFSIIGGLTLINFGLLFGYLAVVLAYGLAFGLIDGVRSSAIDFSFMQNDEISPEVKLAKLQMEYDKWFRGLTIFSGFLVAAGVAGGIQYIIAAPPTIATEQTITFISAVVYPGVGLGLGLYWDVIKKVNLVSQKILEIKSSQDNNQPQCKSITNHKDH